MKFTKPSKCDLASCFQKKNCLSMYFPPRFSKPSYSLVSDRYALLGWRTKKLALLMMTEDITMRLILFSNFSFMFLNPIYFFQFELELF